MTHTPRTHHLSRREFLGGAATLSATLIQPRLARSAAANSALAVGVIGTGGRGNFIAGLLEDHGGYSIVAAADFFPDRLQAFGEKFGVAPAHRHAGLDAYKRLLDEKLDAVVIESPPYFHPEHARAAVVAGKHVFLAKPLAVDVPGCQAIAEAGRQATAKGLCFLVDFQTRNNEFYREAARRVHAGDIGPIVCAEACYHTGRLGIQAPPGTPGARLRNWVFDIALSGDIITEQNIHALDVATWFLDQAPVAAHGKGGRKARTDVGDCWDHFSIIFEFPGELLLTFASTQFNKGYDDIGCRVFGTTGTAETHYGAGVWIRGDKPYTGGNTARIFAEGAFNNITDFHDNIRAGRCDNPTVAPSVRSNLTTVLGRIAAYGRRTVTWEEMMQANAALDARLDELAL